MEFLPQVVQSTIAKIRVLKMSQLYIFPICTVTTRELLVLMHLNVQILTQSWPKSTITAGSGQACQTEHKTNQNILKASVTSTS